MSKKKAPVQIILVALLTTSLMLLAACSSTANSTSGSSGSSGANAAVTYDGTGQSDLGTGIFFVQGTDGTKSSTTTPTVIISKNASSSNIAFEASGYEENPKTYFFIDGTLVAENNIPGKTVGTLTLGADVLKEGTHKAEAVQFKDSKIGGEVVSYKMAEFTIKYE